MHDVSDQLTLCRGVGKLGKMVQRQKSSENGGKPRTNGTAFIDRFTDDVHNSAKRSTTDGDLVRFVGRRVGSITAKRSRVCSESRENIPV